jgi:UDPglucose--hexose-1-phosphate uridylyltransferase
LRSGPILRGAGWGKKSNPKELPFRRTIQPARYVPVTQRLNGQNPVYSGAYWFTNDLPCFGSPSEVSRVPNTEDVLYQRRPALGTAEVVFYHPDHGQTFADLTGDEARAIVDLWAERYRALGARPEVAHVLIFENRGALVGTSNPHPHCQIYAIRRFTGSSNVRS